MARRPRNQRFRLSTDSTEKYFDVRSVVLPAAVLEDLIPGATDDPNRVGDLSADDVRRASRRWAEGRPAGEMQSVGFRWIEIEPEDSDERFELLCVVLIPKDLGVALRWNKWKLEVERSSVDKLCFFVVYARVAKPATGGAS
jgi:hypothetical protein